jgi:hypothetical protein
MDKTSKVETGVDVTTMLANASAAWDLEREAYMIQADRIRTDAVDLGARFVFETEERRRQVLGQHYQSSERLALEADRKAAAAEKRVKVARERSLFLDDGDVEHVFKYKDLHDAALRAGRVLHEQTTLQPVFWNDGGAPDSFFADVERRFEQLHGIRRSGFLAAVSQRDAAASDARRQKAAGLTSA